MPESGGTLAPGTPKKILSAGAVFSTVSLARRRRTNDVRARNYQTKERSASRMSEIAVGHPTIPSTFTASASRSSFRPTIEAEQASERTEPVSRASRRSRPALLASLSVSARRPETRASSSLAPIKLFRLLTNLGLTENNSLAQRKVKEGAVSMSVGESDPPNWQRLTDPAWEIDPRKYPIVIFKVGRRMMKVRFQD